MIQIADSTELWKPIPDYPNYWISTWGRVRNHRYNRILKPSKPTNGYLQVGLSNNGLSKSMCIHQLMALTFLGPKPPKFEISHADDDKENNYLSNLEYVYYKKNRRKRTIYRFCIVCGKLISYYGRTAQTCGYKSACYRLAHYVKIKCDVCGKEFYRSKGNARQNQTDPRYRNKYYCSRFCFFNRPDHPWKKNDLPLLTQVLRATR